MLPFWKLVGWCIYVVLYLYACDGLYQWPEQTPRSVAFKVLPVLQCVFIVLSSNSKQPGYTHYRRHVALGLGLSMCGDAFLVYDTNFREAGGIMFALAHLCYLRAFRSRPFGGGPTLVSYIVLWLSATYYLYPVLKGTELLLVPGYLLLLHSMAWRATVRYITAPSLVNFLLSAGAVLFVVSDIVLFSEWLVAKQSFSPLVVMVTYYLAQLGITLSVTDDFTPSIADVKEKTT